MIINGEEVKQKLLQGIDLVANTVKPTLGPQAKTVILQGNPPVVINTLLLLDASKITLIRR